MPQGDEQDVTRDRAAVLEEYAQLAGQYDSQWSFYVRATSRETLQRMHVAPSDSVLDIGCGTGALLAQLAMQFPDARLAGVDASPEMLAVARKHLPASICLENGWAESLPHPNDSFDAVISCNMFHYIRQPQAALAEMSRVLRPGGTLTITDWCDDYLACRICDRYLRLFNAAHFRTYRLRQCQQMLQQTNLEQVTIDRYKISWLWGLMTASGTKRKARN